MITEKIHEFFGRTIVLTDGDYEYERPIITNKQLKETYGTLPKRVRKRIWKKAWKNNIKSLILGLSIVLLGALEMVFLPEDATPGLFMIVIGAYASISTGDYINYEIYMMSRRKIRLLKNARKRRKTRTVITMNQAR